MDDSLEDQNEPDFAPRAMKSLPLWKAIAFPFPLWAIFSDLVLSDISLNSLNYDDDYIFLSKNFFKTE